ncbi:MAG: ABC transporter ATP-binding protein [Sporomusa sp.]
MLELRNLTKQFRHPSGELLNVVHIEKFIARPGEQIILAGASGSGKTTLLHLIAGLLSPSAGEIAWNGKRIDTLPETKRTTWRAQNVGYVFQKFNLLPGLSVIENIMAASVLSGHPFGKTIQAKVKSLLSQVGLVGRANDRPQRLSTGEQQRVAVIRALINKPCLILADEPTASLDHDNAMIVLDLLQTLCHENQSTLLVATHDQDVKARFPHVYQLSRTGRASECCRY